MYIVKGEGRIVAVCSSPEHGYPTYPQSSVAVGLLGIVGDAHSGPLRESFTNPGKLKPNDRPISIAPYETLQEMNALFPGLHIQPGGFNEQVLVQGLGDLSYVLVGDRVVFNNGVALEVVDNAYPCKKLEAYHHQPGLIDALLIPQEGKKPLTKRGILARVLTPGELSNTNSVSIYRHEESIRK